MKILHELCSVPTAPFAEGQVIQYVEQFVSRRPQLRLSRDTFGNLLIELPSSSRRPRWVFAAHMDHPGFVADRMIDDHTLAAHFRGWVKIDYVQGTKVRFFDEKKEIAGTVVEATGNEYNRITVPDRVKVKVNAPVSSGSPGMFDQGAGRVRDGIFYSRVCDDLAGAAAALTLIDQLRRRPPQVPVAVLLTRAEEEGFIGAMAAILKPKLLRKTDRLIAIECSAMQPYAPQGRGTIIRIGDKTSIFNSDLSYFLAHQAEKLAARDKTFHYQRALMPGGTCEATVYDIYGYQAASICVALGNYHNMDQRAKKIGPEYVDLADWKNMVKLFTRLARTAHEYQPGHTLLKKFVETRFNKLKHLL